MVNETTPQPLVPQPDRIRLAMLGMVPGNGHPFSWSAIINGRYDAERMASCGFPVIPQYLGAQPTGNLGIAGAEVTHVWCDDPADTLRVADCCFIDNRIDRPEDAIGEVDAAFIATDLGYEHVERARPLIEAGVPLFIDKPLADREDHLEQFVAWHEEGRAFHSSSAMRYSPPFVAIRERLDEVGKIKLIVLGMTKTWPTYGMHAIEAVAPLLEPGGWRTVRNAVEGESRIVHVHHDSGVEVLLPTIPGMSGGYGRLSIYGDQGTLTAKSDDTFTAFKSQIEAFIDYLRTGHRPVPFEHVAEQVRVLIAGIQSEARGGAPVDLTSIAAGQETVIV